jgi:hypothetical protein
MTAGGVLYEIIGFIAENSAGLPPLLVARTENKNTGAKMSRIIGGCLCGAIRYEYDGEPGPANYCHCADCRRCTGSAFNIGVRVEAQLFRIVRGSPRSFTKTGDSGNALTRHFCAECGSPLYTSSPRHPEVYYLKAGCLDDPATVRVTHQNWVMSRVPWASISADLPGFSEGTSAR